MSNSIKVVKDINTCIYKYLHLPPLNKIAHGNYLFLLWSSQTILINQTMERNSFALKFEIARFFTLQIYIFVST